MLTDELKQEVVAAYKRGMKLSDIEREFNVVGAVVYTVLREAGAVPNRMKKKVRLTVDGQTAQAWLDRMEEQERTITALEAEIAAQYAEIERLRARVAATGARRNPSPKHSGRSAKRPK